MNIFLKNATSIISHREPCKPITKQELFDMLVSHDAFGGSLVLQHAVRDMISDGFWTEAAHLLNENDYCGVSRLKSRITVSLGYPDEIISAIIDSISSVDDWHSRVNELSRYSCLCFEDIPIGGRTIDFVNRMISKGYIWDASKGCLIGSFYGYKMCEIRYNHSCSVVPFYNVKVLFPAEAVENSLNELVIWLRDKECRSGGSSEFFGGYAITLKRDEKTGRYMIEYIDPKGYNTMIDSPMYTSHNNLETVD